MHRAECPYVKNIADTVNLKNAEWCDDVSLQTVQLKIFCSDYPYQFDDEAANASIIVLNTEMVQLGKNVKALLATIQVQDIEQLKKFTNKLRLLPGIEGVKTK